MPTGNTDTRFYWDLSEGQIFRYNHNSGGSDGIPAGVHTVDESAFIIPFCRCVRFLVLTRFLTVRFAHRVAFGDDQIFYDVDCQCGRVESCVSGVRSIISI